MRICRGFAIVSSLTLALAAPAVAGSAADIPAPELRLSADGPAEPAVAEAQAALVPDPAPVIILPEDVATPLEDSASIVGALPPLPEPAPVVIDRVEPADNGITVRRSPIIEPDIPEPAVAANGQPTLDDAAIAALIPPPPDVPPLVLPDIEMPTIMAEPTAPAMPEAAPMLAAPAVDLAPLIAARLAEGLALSRLPERERQAIVSFYETRGQQPLWVSAEGVNPAGRALLTRLSRAAEDGLRAGDYALQPAAATPEGLALMEAQLSARAVLFARDARGGRLEPRRVMAIATARPEVPGAAEVMAGLADAADVDAVLASWLPSHAGYRALRDKLAELRADAALAEPPPQIPTGPSVRIGMRDPRLPLLRARLGLGPTEEVVYDRALAARVAGFQREAGLPASGVLNPATIAALNQPARAALEGDIIATMERWRWLPTDAGRDHLIVNVPEFMVRKVEDGRVVHAARVVVGKNERATPIFSDMMDHLVINPSWTVPPTILREDFLPKMAKDPEYASRRGMEVIRRGERITLRQPPGPTNALGQIKFMFPNDHAVYLHDTPQRNLFNASSRAFSSGCVRVENPFRLAELVLGGEGAGWSQQRLRSLLGPAERTIRLATPLPVHLTYMTVTVDDSGSVRRFEDIYGLHRRTREALGL